MVVLYILFGGLTIWTVYFCVTFVVDTVNYRKEIESYDCLRKAENKTIKEFKHDDRKSRKVRTVASKWRL